MSFFQDLMSVWKKRDLVFRERIQESEDVYSFIFAKSEDLTWRAGQYGLFSIAHTKIKNPTKPFSIASAPAENSVRITTRIPGSPSDFKKALLELKPGMTVKMSGPLGSFYPEENGPTLLVAGGIGMTPFRSILMQRKAEGKKAGSPIHLLYMDSSKSYLYSDELDEIAAGDPFVRVAYLSSREELNQELETFLSSNKSMGSYLTAGSKSFADSVSAYFRNKDVPKKKIKRDAFTGY
ncbi:FAD-dependent oxidoreductase [Cohnella hongkongensis]|uniref:FAD-dependent oxidoreductase n=1 Tax=Cohnella hongkongensis TaxID=178337 RepID=A0ABV9F9Q0_9BACL